MEQIFQWFQNHMIVLLLSVGGMLVFIWLMQFRQRLQVKWYAIVLITVILMIYGVISLKLFAILEVFGDLDSAANMRLYGVVFFDPIAFYITAKVLKKRPAEIFDIFSIGMILSMICGRFNCILTGCCDGTLIPFLPGHRWPIREIEMIYYFTFLARYGKRVLKGETNGEVYPVYMITYGALRFVLEFFREEASLWGSLHPAWVWSIISLCLGLSIYSEVKSPYKKKERR